MALILPATSSSFGDSTKTEGPGRVYVLAQVPATADVEWVREVRALLQVPELKWNVLKQHRPRLKSDRALWRRIEAGVAQATIIAVDMDWESYDALNALIRERGYDFELHDKDMFEQMQRSVLARSPIAYLPDSLARALPNAPQVVGRLGDFTPDAIRARLGPKLLDTVILAARAHALFDVDLLRRDSGARTTQDAFTSPYAAAVLRQILETQRTFDAEAPRTLQILNDASDAIATALGPSINATAESLVRECSSLEHDQLQVADVAAAWARETIDIGEAWTTTSRFENVWVNGTLLRGR